MQRAIEKRAIPTVSISVALDVTERIKPPRAIFLPFMMGHLFGVPFYSALQRQIILEACDFLTTAKRSGDVRKISISWAEARKQGKEIERNLQSKN